MILNQTLTFNINENRYSFRTLKETDVSSLYIDGLKENGINLERIPKSLTIESQKKYVNDIIQSRNNTICGLFQDNILIGTIGIQSNTLNSKRLYIDDDIDNIVTIGLFLLDIDNYGKGFGKILVFSSIYLYCADTGSKHFGTRIKNDNIMSKKSFLSCGFEFTNKVNTWQYFYLNHDKLIIPNNISRINEIRKYHPYVFDLKNRKFVGNFNEMYLAEKKEDFDSWEQDNLEYIEKKVILQLLKDNNFKTIVDLGCGKGALTNKIKENANQVIGIDIAPFVILQAKEKYNDIKFICSDINQISLKEILDYEINNNLNVDCIVCIQLLAYLSNWKTIVGEFSFISKYLLINLDFPDNPIGFVKSKVELTEIIRKYYDIIEDIDFVNKYMSIIFCKSKNI